MPTSKGPRIVVIGGGTGSFTVLSGLKYYARDITAIVNMSDDGGSTGLLRDELGALPPGDIRQCLVALSESDQVMRDLFNYRFGDGSLKGHSFGNLFLTALEKTTGSFAQAVRTAGKVLNISGRVMPVTLTDSKLVLAQPDGSQVVGQHAVESANFAKHRPQLMLTPAPRLNPEAKAAIEAADLVVIAPGNLYASLAPALIVPGLGDTLAAAPARVIYVSNLVTKPGQTDGFAVDDFAHEIERFVGQPVLNYVIYNQHKPSRELLEKYARQGEYAVEFDPQVLAHKHYKTLAGDLVSGTIPKLSAADNIIPRTLIRHDPDKTARLIMQVYFS
ncbi:MAG TPA: gluconeogenesis factor YvcK family protein [Candidatus Saccharimonadia bacterium]